MFEAHGGYEPTITYEMFEAHGGYEPTITYDIVSQKYQVGHSYKNYNLLKFLIYLCTYRTIKI